ncbi:MAG: hypothetical protein OXE50_05635 [Chloroflexi bacterium]|nr:hypothetical protein [Chloroflexota bacterium]
MVDAAKHNYTAGMDDAYVAALAPKAHERLGAEAGNALMFSLHLARRVERRLEDAQLPDAALSEIDAALGSWSQEFSAAVCTLAEATPEAKGQAVQQADRALTRAQVASAAGHRAGLFEREPHPEVHVGVTEEDMLLANAGLQDYVDMLHEVEYGSRYGPQGD